MGIATAEDCTAHDACVQKCQDDSKLKLSDDQRKIDADTANIADDNFAITKYLQQITDAKAEFAAESAAATATFGGALIICYLTPFPLDIACVIAANVVVDATLAALGVHLNSVINGIEINLHTARTKLLTDEGSLVQDQAQLAADQNAEMLCELGCPKCVPEYPLMKF